jgi:hypothetical protein
MNKEYEQAENLPPGTDNWLEKLVGDRKGQYSTTYW